jgi:3-oxoacyl-[acyl-carrier-protein] synthase-3
MRYKHVCIESFGYAIPPQVVTSSSIEDKLATLYQRLKLPFGRLEMMSGIKERRFWEPQTKPSDASKLAGIDALKKSGVEGSQIEALFHTSVCRDMLEPSSACFVHQGLGLSQDAIVYDLSNACLGFLNGMVNLANMIELGQVQRGLIVAGESSRQLVETTIENLLKAPNVTRESIKDAFASLTIGSGACAVVMAHENVTKFGHHLMGGAAQCASEFNHLCRGNANTMSTDSESLLKEGCKLARQTWSKTRDMLGWTNEMVSRVFCHQVGSAHRRTLYETLELESKKDFSTLEFLGNTGSVALPITLAIGTEQSPPQKDEKIALLGIGSGLNCMMLGIQW